MTRASPHPFRWLLTILSATGLLLAMLAPAAVAQQSPSDECPEGMTAVAKYEFREGSYVLAEDFDDSPVTIDDGDATFADWSSSVGIDAIFVFGGNDGELYQFDDPQFSGTVTDDDLQNDGDQTPAISHITFCVADDDGNGGNGGADAVSLTITKIEEGESDTTLEGADFDLYLDDGDDTFESDEDSFEDSGTTGSDGTLTFSGLDPNETYFVVETDAPDNYEVIGDGATLVEVGESNASVTVENAPVTEVSPTVSLTVTKVEQGNNDNTLAGAIFELYADDGDTSGELDDDDSQHGTECTTDDEGVCVFSGLSPNSTYFLVETQAPDQYEIVGDGVREITTGEEDVSETVPNAAITDVRSGGDERDDEGAVDDEGDEQAEVLDVQLERDELARTGTETDLAIWASALLFAGAMLLLFPGQRLMPATASRSPGRTRTNGAVWTAGDAGSLWSAAPEGGERSGSRIWNRDGPG